jgi:hypothetical protein
MVKCQGQRSYCVQIMLHRYSEKEGEGEGREREGEGRREREGGGEIPCAQVYINNVVIMYCGRYTFDRANIRN